MTGTAKAISHINNDRVIVTEFRFAPGDNTGWHRHGLDYVILPMTNGKVRLETKSGTASAEMTAGKPYYRQVGVEHDVINAGDGELVFFEIEIK